MSASVPVKYPLSCTVFRLLSQSLDGIAQSQPDAHLSEVDAIIQVILNTCIQLLSKVLVSHTHKSWYSNFNNNNNTVFL